MRKAVRVESNRKPILFWKVLVLVPGVGVEREGWEAESGKRWIKDDSLKIVSSNEEFPNLFGPWALYCPSKNEYTIAYS